jgi:hypothetical protein
MDAGLDKSPEASTDILGIDGVIITMIVASKVNDPTNIAYMGPQFPIYFFDCLLLIERLLVESELLAG